MSPKEAVADVFMTAFQALSEAEQDAILVKMVKDEELRQDLVDLAIAETRSREKTRSFKTVLREIKGKRNSR